VRQNPAEAGVGLHLVHVFPPSREYDTTNDQLV
jgi:hypothetical protein